MFMSDSHKVFKVKNILLQYTDLGPIKCSIIFTLKENKIPMNPGKLTKYFDMSPQALSQHLKSLEKEGWIKSSINGTFRPYVVVQKKLDELNEFMQKNLGSTHTTKITEKTIKEKTSMENENP